MTKAEEDLIIAEQNKSRDEILKAIEKEKCELLGIIQGKDKAIAELEKKISILLSCQNCPENKGGLICAKEYENKCLAQKIEFIKELQQENVELKGEADSVLDNWCRGDDPCPHLKKQDEQLTKAKDLLKWFIWYFREGSPNLVPYKHKVEEAEQFLNSEVEKW